MKDKSKESSTGADGDAKLIPRRQFLGRSLNIAGAAMLGTAMGSNTFVPVQAGNSSSKKAIALGPLTSKFKFKGGAFRPSDKGFNEIATGGLWNKLCPERRPQLVLQVADEDDVVAAVNFARENKLKIAVRGGGHNWCAPSLRNSGVLLDLSKLDKVISVDPVARKAVLQPIISNRQVQAHLNPLGLSYPSGHCPPVKLSGYLLSGGMAWNQGVWGHGAGSVEAIEMVTAEGKKIVASEHENQDYFWAARGGGSGLFAVCTRYHLKLYPLPKAIHASSYTYPYESLSEVAAWLGPLTPKLGRNVELSIFIVQAPAELASKCKSSNGKVCMVTATVFADSAEEAKAARKPLDTCPILDKCLAKSLDQPKVFEELFDMSGSLWPGNLRCKVDALFSNASGKELLDSVQEHCLKASPKTIVMFAFFTGGHTKPEFDGAFAIDAKIYGGPWTMWDDTADDKENIAWHEKCVNLLKPHICAHYVGETNTTGHNEFAKASYTEPSWERLKRLRARYDPEGVFFNYTDGLS